jgi:glycosyltransferase involved in cell wall biosynthesis
MSFQSTELKQIHFSPIEPFLETPDRPFWSVMITSYRRTDYLEQVLRSVLSQDPGVGQMQIEVVDDCSPNRNEIEALVNEIGQGRISFYSSPTNVGIYANWNTCIQRARGHWVHILSDDDVLLPGFYQVYGELIRKTNCSVVVSQSIFTNEHDQWTGMTPPLQQSSGLLENALLVLSETNPIRTPSIVVAREAYEKVGGFTTDLIYTPDWEMWTRLAASTKVAYVNRPYSLFRMHSQSTTNRLILTGESVTDTLSASKIIQTRIQEPKDKKKVQLSVNRWLAFASFSLSQTLVQQKYYKPALLHAVWSFRLFPSLAALKNMGIILMKVWVAILKNSWIQKPNV